ncbi:MAG: glutathione synthase [Rickettsiales bacterium]|nr:glutathione synthase [Rickettsiales bacterium]
MKIAFQTDNIETLKIATDSSLSLAKEALSRNFNVWFYTPENLTYKKNNLFTIANQIIDITNTNVIYRKAKRILLNDSDVLFIRQNPPFNMNYITTTYLLDLLKDTLIVNNPTAIRNFTEKLSILMFPELIPKTAVTSNLDEAKEFLNTNKSIVCKTLYEFGGNDIKKFDLENSKDFLHHFQLLSQKSNTPLMLQKFIPSITKGDKRIIIVDGKPIGALKKVPRKGTFISNLCAGGEAQKTTLTKRDIVIAQQVGASLLKHNIAFAGIDVIGKYLTEINVTSPTGLVAINKLSRLESKQKLESIIWDTLLEKHKRAILLRQSNNNQ